MSNLTNWWRMGDINGGSGVTDNALLTYKDPVPVVLLYANTTLFHSSNDVVVFVTITASGVAKSIATGLLFAVFTSNLLSPPIKFPISVL